MPNSKSSPKYSKAEGGLIKRADGSYSKRGLWDNIRANRGSGRKPTAEMLRQERKIRAEEYEQGGPIYNWIPPIYPRVGARYENGSWVMNSSIPTPTTPSYYPDYTNPTLTNYQMGTPKSNLPIRGLRDATPEIPAYGNGSTVVTKSANPTPSLEKQINKELGYPMTKAAEAADSGEKWFNPKTKKWEKEDPVDNLRHAMAGKYTAEAIADKFPGWMQYTPIPKTVGFLGANALGIGHELTAINKNPNYSWWDKAREAGEDIFNNLVGAAAGSLPISNEQKENILFELSRKNLLPDGYGKGNMYFKKHGGPIKYAHGATVYTNQEAATWVNGTEQIGTQDTRHPKRNTRTESPATAMPYPEIKITGPTNPYMPASPPVLQGYNPYNGPMRLHAPDTTKMARNGGQVTEEYKKRAGIPYAINPGISDAGMYVGPTTQRGITFGNGGPTDNKRIITKDPADPALHSYLDSLNLYNAYLAQSKINPVQDASQNIRLDPRLFSDQEIEEYKKKVTNFKRWPEEKRKKFFKNAGKDYWTSEAEFKKDVPEDSPLIDVYKKLTFSTPTTTGLWTTPDLYNTAIAPVDIYLGGQDPITAAFNPVFPKPKVPVEYSGNPADYMKYRSAPTIIGTSYKFKPQVSLPNFQQRPSTKIPLMPMRGMPSISTEEAMPQKVNVPSYTNKLPAQYMDTRGEWSDKPQVPPVYTEEQLLKMGYRAPQKKANGGDVPPYVTSDPKEFARRQQLYNDSLSLYNKTKWLKDLAFDGSRTIGSGQPIYGRINYSSPMLRDPEAEWNYYNNINRNIYPIGVLNEWYQNPHGALAPTTSNERLALYKKPVQKIIYQPAEVTKMPMRGISPLDVNVEADVKSRPTWRNWNTGEVMYDIPEHLKIGSNWRSPEKKANGGWLDSYEDGGDVDPITGVPKPYLNPAMVQATLKSANENVYNTLGQLISTPQSREKARREKIIAKDPSKYNANPFFGTPDYQLGIIEPELEDATLDAIDALSMLSGAGYLVKKGVEQGVKLGLSQIPKVFAHKPSSPRSNFFSNIILNDIKDIFNQKGKKEGIDWLRSWYNDPITKQKIIDLQKHNAIISNNAATKYSQYIYPNKRWGIEDVNRLTIPESNFWVKGYSNWDKYIPHTYDNSGKLMIKKGNTEVGKLMPKKSTTIHEGTHQLTHNGGFFNKETEDLLQQGFKTNKNEVIPDWTGKLDETYYMSPTEIHARINEIRASLNLKPSDIITENMFDNIMRTPAGLDLKPYIKNKKLFIETMNKIPAIVPAAIGTTALGAMQQKKNGGWLDNL